MLEKKILKFEKNSSFLKLFLSILFCSFIIILVMFFFAKSSIFVIAFLSLLLANPVSKYLKKEDFEITNKNYSFSDLFVRFEREMFVFWIIFISGIFIFYFLNFLNFEFIYQQRIYELFAAGKFIDFNSPFIIILLNNLGILFLTFLLTTLITSSLVFIIYWNASIISYFLYQTTNVTTTSIIMLPHILLESGGYILVGFAGTLLSFKLDTYKNKNFKIFLKDFLFLIFLSIIFIFLGALVESL